MILTAAMQKAPIQKGFPRLLAIYMDDSASSYYRIQLPAQALIEAGYPVTFGHIDTFRDATINYYDALLFLRTGSGVSEKVMHALQAFKDAKKLVLLDYDDDVLHIPKHNPGHIEDVSGILTALKLADGISVTNSALAAVFRAYNRNIQVIPNYIRPADWEYLPIRKSEKLVVGLTGSPSHVRDWELVAEPLSRIRKTFDVDILIGGFFPDYFRGIVTQVVDWIPLQAYPTLVNMIDIGLCPLIDDDFNAKKTPIKSYELALVHAAVVGSPTQYGQVIRGKGTIARTVDEWYEAIARYITDPDRRRRDARALNQYVTSRLAVHRHTLDIARSYRQLMRSEVA